MTYIYKRVKLTLMERKVLFSLVIMLLILLLQALPFFTAPVSFSADGKAEISELKEIRMEEICDLFSDSRDLIAVFFSRFYSVVSVFVFNPEISNRSISVVVGQPINHSPPVFL